MATLKNQTLPWQKTITVELPFDASLEGKYVLDPDADIPETVQIGHHVLIRQTSPKTHTEQRKDSKTIPKEKLEEALSSNTVSFSLKYSL